MSTEFDLDINSEEYKEQEKNVKDIQHKTQHKWNDKLIEIKKIDTSSDIIEINKMLLSVEELIDTLESYREVPLMPHNWLKSLIDESEKGEEMILEVFLKKITSDDIFKSQFEELEKYKELIESKDARKHYGAVKVDLERFNITLDNVKNTLINLPDISGIDKESIYTDIHKLTQISGKIADVIRIANAPRLTEAEKAYNKIIQEFNEEVISTLEKAHTREFVEEKLNEFLLFLDQVESSFSGEVLIVQQIVEKRNEITQAYNAKKEILQDERNKNIVNLEDIAYRLLKGISLKIKSFKSREEIRAFFKGDQDGNSPIEQLNDILEKLRTEYEEGGKSEIIQTKLKNLQQETLRQLKDDLEIYSDNGNVLKLGNYEFGVNKQPLNLTMVNRDNELFFHLTGTGYYEKIENEELLSLKEKGDRALISESLNVCRSTYMAYKVYTKFTAQDPNLLNRYDYSKEINDYLMENYTEGYVKGVHDKDGEMILRAICEKHVKLKILRFPPDIRAYGQFFWVKLAVSQRSEWDNKIKNTFEVLEYFPKSDYSSFLSELVIEIQEYANYSKLFDPRLSRWIAEFLFFQRSVSDKFEVSLRASELYKDFKQYLEENKVWSQLIGKLRNNKFSVSKGINLQRIELASQWISAYIEQIYPEHKEYTYEIVTLLLFGSQRPVIKEYPEDTVYDLRSKHPTYKDACFYFNFHHTNDLLNAFIAIDVPAYNDFIQLKRSIIDEQRNNLQLSSLEPKILSSFVRNQLVSQVYMPIIGENLSKQIGAMGSQKRSDRMGALLLISPPGYGKTTLMEYVSNRLGLTFVKINGPSIGHEVTDLDPDSATNKVAKEELLKLNLSFEMGDNIMLYIDDIQHCNPEFLQKFISLADGTRTVDGVYKGRAKSYELRSKKFCLIMAGNPYTETGAKFQIPDMLANRADIYNLGDVIGDTKHLFDMSMIENAVTSNPMLSELNLRNIDDLIVFCGMVAGTHQEDQLQAHYTDQEIKDYLGLIENINKVKDVLVIVNETYIKSAAIADEYRTEPAFKLQGSYRDMNKIIAKINPTSNDVQIVDALITHYKNESQTLGTEAEANILKYKLLTNTLTDKDQERWDEIIGIFGKQQELKGFANADGDAQLMMQLMEIGKGLNGIESALLREPKN